MQTTITVEWSAFARNAESIKESGKVVDAKMTFVAEIPPAMFDQEILELLFEQTNLYAGDVWTKHFEGKMPENRTHTALSVGDKVRIERDGDNGLYVCADFGWELLTFNSLWMDQAKPKAVK
jgi:hypothetical protein